jgi:hypothetical protein
MHISIHLREFAWLRRQDAEQREFSGFFGTISSPWFRHGRGFPANRMPGDFPKNALMC